MKEGAPGRLRTAAIVARMVLAVGGTVVISVAVVSALVLVAILLRADRREELRNRADGEK
jgi:hypothetical protein